LIKSHLMIGDSTLWNECILIRTLKREFRRSKNNELIRKNVVNDRLQALQSNVVGLVAITDVIKRHELKVATECYNKTTPYTSR